MKRKKFTLIELMVVISIIIILISLLMPSLGKARSQTKRIACAGQMRQIHFGLTNYAGNFRGWYPLGVWTTQAAMGLYDGSDIAAPDSYFGSPKILRCPDSKEACPPASGYLPPNRYWSSFAPRITSYRFTACHADSFQSFMFYGMHVGSGFPSRNDNRVATCIPKENFTDSIRKDPVTGQTVYIHPPSLMPALFDGREFGKTTWVPYAVGSPMMANHSSLNGINIAFVDGHCGWGIQNSTTPQRITLYGTNGWMRW